MWVTWLWKSVLADIPHCWTSNSSSPTLFHKEDLLFLISPCRKCFLRVHSNPLNNYPGPISSKNKHFNGRDFDGRRCPKGSHRVTPLPAGAICWLDSKTLARYKSFTQQNMSVCSPRLTILKFPYKGSVFGVFSSKIQWPRNRGYLVLYS